MVASSRVHVPFAPFLLGRELSKLIPAVEQGQDSDKEEISRRDLEEEEKAVVEAAAAAGTVLLRRA